MVFCRRGNGRLEQPSDQDEKEHQEGWELQGIKKKKWENC
jgi:hypothetical protein